MMRQLSGWRWRVGRITPSETAFLVEAQVALLACQITKWSRPTGKLVRGATNATTDSGLVDVRTALLVGWAVKRTAEYGFFRPRCLVRALAIQRMLRRRGLSPGELRIGVRMQGGRLLAHAWVEVGGRVIGDVPQHVRTFATASDLRLVEL
jgi:hypothetical protein